MDLTIRGKRLEADFTCLEHEPCELVDIIRDNDLQESSDLFFFYPAVLIWCRDENPQLLRSGEVDIQKKVFPWGTTFVEWSYTEPVPSYNQFNDNSEPNHDHALIGAVGADTHEANFAVKCLHGFDVMDWCPVQQLCRRRKNPVQERVHPSHRKRTRGRLGSPMAVRGRFTTFLRNAHGTELSSYL
jgi:hypothetical protein